MKRIFVGLLIIVIMGVCSSCGYVSSAELLSYSISDKNIELTIDTQDIKYNMSFLNFSAELISRVNEDKNTLLSPLAIYIALSMLVNGCDNNTKDQIEEMLSLNVDELNEYCYYIISGFDRDNSTLNIANSLWVNRDMNVDVKESYLDVNALYYDIEVYRDSFGDKKALSNINYWVEVNTQGMIKKILDSIDPMTAMILINSLYFEAEWIAKHYDYLPHNFTNHDGKAKSVDFINGSSRVYYYSDKADAIKVALEDDYYFLGILPQEDDIDNYLKSFNGEELYNLTTQSRTTDEVFWRLPRFDYDYNISLSDTLKAMGMTDAFNPNIADLSRLSDNDLFVKDVMHKTKIELDKSGIKAAAVTAIVCATTSIPMHIKYIYLDRPFVYTIMDAKTNTPIFIGVVKNL